jgi:diaminopimelate epimerase
MGKARHSTGSRTASKITRRPFDFAFSKVSGTGNDFILIDWREEENWQPDWPEVARATCDPVDGIGADGLIVLHQSWRDTEMGFFNADGSTPAVCGNALRTVAHRLHCGVKGSGAYRIQARDGWHQAQVNGRQIAVTMLYEKKKPRVCRAECPTGALEGYFTQVGVPHFVTRVDLLASSDWDALAGALRSAPVFPEGANINLWSPGPKGSFRMRTFERGVIPGETRACGSGAVAVARVLQTHYNTGLPVRLRALGGTLHVHPGEKPGNLMLQGTVREVFRGVFPMRISITQSV